MYFYILSALMENEFTKTIINEYFLNEQAVRISFAILFALIFYLIYIRFVRNFLGKTVLESEILAGRTGKREKRIKSWILFADRIGGGIIIISLLLFIMSELNFNISPILTGAGILGLVLGLGSQALIKDVLGGFFILLEGQYGVGDKVKIAGLDGEVKQITLRKTILFKKKSGAIHTIPNGEVKTVTVFKKKGAK